MTYKRDLKRKIRERQAQTGERYTTAREHVLDRGAEPDWVLSLHDVSAEARAAGFTCRVFVSARIGRAGPILEQLRQLLTGPLEGVDRLRAAALTGRPGSSHPLRSAIDLVTDVQTFFANLRLGIRGPGPGGGLLAFETAIDRQPRTIIAQLLPRHTGESVLVLSLFPDETALLDSLALWSRA